MSITTRFLILFAFTISVNAQAAIDNTVVKSALLNKYMVNYTDKAQITMLKAETLKQGGQSVEALIEVM